MGDPPNSNSVPPYDPYDSPINYDFFGIANDSNPTLANLSSTNDPNASFNPFGDTFSHNINNNNNLLSVWDHNYNYNINTTTTQQAGPSSSSHQPGPSSASQQPGFTRPLLAWPPEAVPFQCSCCQVLREIIHNDVTGRCATKLEIHGRVGIICHAILEIKDRISFVPSPSEFHMIDFCKKSIDTVKEYLQEYCNDQKRAGLVMVQDPLSTFYEALCVGIPWQENNVNNEQPIFPGNDQFVNPEQAIVVAQVQGERVPRTNLAQQRERAARLTLGDLQEYFHLTIEEAGRQMNLCPTVLKKTCRRYDIPRWPHRKIKSLRRQISNFRALLSSSIDAEERARAEARIQRLEAKIENICAGVNNDDDDNDDDDTE